MSDDRHHQAFLDAVREAPDDDAPRLVYADWLDDHAGPAGQARADLVRTQCRLARLDADDPLRDGLARREAELLSRHALDWTDLAFADWLGHGKRSCRNPQGHGFCEIVRQGVTARVRRDRFPAGDAARAPLDAELDELGRRMQADFGFLPGTCDVPLFDTAEFRRGFVESGQTWPFVVELFAEALPAVAPALRSLEIDSDEEDADDCLSRLAGVLGKTCLAEIDCHCPLYDRAVLRKLVACKAARRLVKLHLWLEDPDWGAEDGDGWVALVAGAKNLAGLLDLELEHTRTFTAAAFEAILASRPLSGLLTCRLRPNEDMPLSADVVARFAARFGPDVETDATVEP